MGKSQRERLALTHDELCAYLAATHTIVLATNGPRGWPHLGPLWFYLGEEQADHSIELWAWTYGPSQKVVNLRRDSRATVQVEDGTAYGELRGAVLEVETEIIEDLERVEDVGMRVLARYASGDVTAPKEPKMLAEEARATVSVQAPKRVALRMVERRRMSWDHRKLHS